MLIEHHIVRREVVSVVGAYQVIEESVFEEIIAISLGLVSLSVNNIVEEELT